MSVHNSILGQEGTFIQIHLLTKGTYPNWNFTRIELLHPAHHQNSTYYIIWAMSSTKNHKQ